MDNCWWERRGNFIRIQPRLWWYHPNKFRQSWNVRSTISIYANQWISQLLQNGTQITNPILLRQQWSYHEAEKITEKGRNYYSSSRKIKDIDAVLVIQTYIPTTVTVTHFKGRQDRKKRKDQRIIAENLDIKVDRIIGKNASTSKFIHIRNTPIVVYINKTYIPNNIRK